MIEEEFIQKVEDFDWQDVDSSFADFLFEELFKDDEIDEQVEQSVEQMSGAF